MASNPRLAIIRFTAKRVRGAALMWGALFAFTMLTSAVGFVTAFPTAKDKAQLLLTFGSNAGLKALIGQPFELDTVSGFTQWRSLGVAMIIGAIWALLLSVKLFREDEEQGRLELLLAGEVTQRQATFQILMGAGIGLLFLAAAAFVGAEVMAYKYDSSIGHLQAVFTGLSYAAAPAIFIALGALVSQISASRRQAAGLMAGIFGISILIRAIADAITGYENLRYLTPLGWVENLQPLTDPQAGVMAGIAFFVIVASALAVYIAGVRDMGSGLLSEPTQAKANFHLLGSVPAFSFRMVRGSLFAWGLGIITTASAFAGITKPAAQAFADSQAVHSILSRISNLSTGAAGFLGTIFMMLITILMIMAVAAVGSIREEEADGHLDALLVRSVSRVGWLAGRITLAAGALALTGLLSGIAAWLVVRNQDLGLGYSLMANAGLNMIPAALFVFGVGILVYGVLPRYAVMAGYTIVVVSFLIQLLAAALDVPEWILNLSLLKHIAFAPAVDPNWHNNGIMLALALVFALLGTYFFSRRDIASE